MARAGLCSRREAESWIAAGRVAVNGKAIASPALNIGPDDSRGGGRQAAAQAERTRLFLYHKPRGLVTTHADPEGRPTIFGKLPKDLPRLISVGRLDLSTEGLLLLTNDGGLARVLELPETGWLRRYRVRAHGSVTQAQLDALRKGVTVDGVRYGEIEATLDRHQGANVWLTFAIREGKNREVRNVLEHLGLAREPADPRVVRPVPARRAAGRRASRKSAPGICANSSANASHPPPAWISPGRSCSIALPFRRRRRAEETSGEIPRVILRCERSAHRRMTDRNRAAIRRNPLHVQRTIAAVRREAKRGHRRMTGKRSAIAQ